MAISHAMSGNHRALLPVEEVACSISYLVDLKISSGRSANTLVPRPLNDSVKHHTPSASWGKPRWRDTETASIVLSARSISRLRYRKACVNDEARPERPITPTDDATD